ncbi:MAG: hypothetical protein HRU34_00860 [Richelia sp.]|nr:hypothetical protein [Richelia sp.]
MKEGKAEYLLQQLKFHKKLHKTTQNYHLWQEGSHPQALMSEKIFIQKLEFIHNNPVRRGYADELSHWRDSSYRNYVNGERILALLNQGMISLNFQRFFNAFKR